MAKKESSDNRVIYVSREAFFALIEAFIYDKITGKELPDDYVLPSDYDFIVDDGSGFSVWEQSLSVCNDRRAGRGGIIIDYQSDTIARLHDLGYSYRVLDRKDGCDNQLNLFDMEEETA